jgi:hypothetical protein
LAFENSPRLSVFTPAVNAGAKMHRFAGAKMHQRCSQKSPRTGGFFVRH